MLCIDLFLTTSTTPNKRIFNDKGMDAFKQLLQITDWSTIEQLADSEGPDVAYASFISKYKSLYDVAFPITSSAKIKKQKSKNKIPNNPGCLQSCLNHVVRNLSSIKNTLKILPLRINSNSLNIEINSS